MSQVTLYTQCHQNTKVKIRGKIVEFDSDGEATCDEEIAEWAAKNIPREYGLGSKPKAIIKGTVFSNEPSGDGVGKRAASVVEAEQKVKATQDLKEEITSEEQNDAEANDAANEALNNLEDADDIGEEEEETTPPATKTKSSTKKNTKKSTKKSSKKPDSKDEEKTADDWE